MAPGKPAISGFLPRGRNRRRGGDHYDSAPIRDSRYRRIGRNRGSIGGLFHLLSARPYHDHSARVHFYSGYRGSGGHLPVALVRGATLRGPDQWIAGGDRGRGGLVGAYRWIPVWHRAGTAAGAERTVWSGESVTCGYPVQSGWDRMSIGKTLLKPTRSLANNPDPLKSACGSGRWWYGGGGCGRHPKTRSPSKSRSGAVRARSDPARQRSQQPP